tara:strand:+ start:113 stop:544 length:432 start_codon:yes stop_codon:yes gene_type:complete
MNNSSVGDFAAQILAQERSTHGAPTPPVQAAPVASQGVGGPMPDISQVAVPTEFVGSLVEGVAPTSSPVSQFPQAVTPVVEDTSEIKALISEVRDLLIEVKQTLTEMTSVGMLGAGIETKKKKKDEDDLTSLLRQVRKKRASR